MRQIVSACILLIAVAALWSCSTMAAYEQERQQRLGIKAKPTPTPTPTPSAEGVDARAMPTEAPRPQPLDPKNGTLLQPWVSPPPRDALGDESKNSAAAAEALVESTRPDKSVRVAPGPQVPVLKTVLRSPDDLVVALRVYQAYAEAVHAVRVSVDAYGLKPNVAALRQVRAATEYWRQWFADMHIYPETERPGVKEIQEFYAAVGAAGGQVQADLAAVNTLLERQRTRPAEPAAGAASADRPATAP